MEYLLHHLKSKLQLKVTARATKKKRKELHMSKKKERKTAFYLQMT